MTLILFYITFALWYNFIFLLELHSNETIFTEQESNQTVPEKDTTDDIDDDDDDLEPIETLEAPIKCNIAYIRDFIETLSEDKPYEERLATFSALPNVVKHQIKHEHSQVRYDLILFT